MKQENIGLQIFFITAKVNKNMYLIGILLNRTGSAVAL
jgi:hypothetical protein